MLLKIKKPEHKCSGFENVVRAERLELSHQRHQNLNLACLPIPPRSRMWWPHLESNQGHKDFQSFALPTELCGHFLNLRIIERGFLSVKYYFKNIEISAKNKVLYRLSATHYAISAFSHPWLMNLSITPSLSHLKQYSHSLSIN